MPNRPPPAPLHVLTPGFWTLTGGADPDFDELQRELNEAALTDPNLLTSFRRRSPEHANADYDEIVRRLDYVWDCPHDGTANVTGYRCASCRRTRARARAEPPAYSKWSSS